MDQKMVKEIFVCMMDTDIFLSPTDFTKCRQSRSQYQLLFLNLLAFEISPSMLNLVTLTLFKVKHNCLGK